MAQPSRTVSAQVIADTNIVTTAETVAATLPGVNTRDRLEPVAVSGVAQVTAGVGTTALTPRVRRGVDATGVLVGEGNPLTVAAGNTLGVPFAAVDVPGEVAGQSYVLTVQQTAATGNGTILAAAGLAVIGG